MKNKINQYNCGNNHSTVTIDIDDGVTPFIIGCPICGKSAFSCFYKVRQDLEPTYEWYKPSQKKIKKLRGDMRDHVESGGLMFRKIHQKTEK